MDNPVDEMGSIRQYRRQKRPQLKREAGLLQIVTYGVGNIIGAGIYVLVAGAAGLAGNAMWLGFVIAAIVALFTGLSYAELSAMYPYDASEYVYVGRAYGNHALSFTAEWLMVVSEIVAAAAVSLGFAQYFKALFPAPPLFVAMALLGTLTLIAALGIKISLKLNMVLSLVAIAGLLLVIASGVGSIGSVNYTLSASGTSGIVAAAALIFFAYMGFDNIANLSEETKKPRKTLPEGLLIAMALTTVLYVLVGICAVSVVPWQTLASSSAPLALVASFSFGHIAYYVLAIIALLTTFNTALVLLISGSRELYGMSRSGVLPKIIGKVNGRTHTPLFASGLMLVIALMFVQIGSVDTIAEITSAGVLLVFALVNISALHLRRVAPHVHRPFRSPLSIGWLPISAVIGAVLCLALLTRFSTESLLFGLALPVSGIIVFMIFNHGKMTEIDEELHEIHLSELKMKKVRA